MYTINCTLFACSTSLPNDRPVQKVNSHPTFLEIFTHNRFRLRVLSQKFYCFRKLYNTERWKMVRRLSNLNLIPMHTDLWRIVKRNFWKWRIYIQYTLAEYTQNHLKVEWQLYLTSFDSDFCKLRRFLEFWTLFG